MNIQERPVNIIDYPSKPGMQDNPDGVVSFKITDRDGNTTATINQHIWINKKYLIEKGMNWFTHRRVFRQIQKIGHGMIPVSLKIKTKEGYRVFVPDTYRSILENSETK